MDPIKNYFSCKGLKSEDIPSIPLYMDQLLQLLEEELGGFKRSDEDKLLTKTMINNYVKAEVISSPEKKKYTKDQMMQLIMVYHLKNILSLKDVKSLIDQDVLPVADRYEYFLQEQQRQLSQQAKAYEALLDQPDQDKMSLLLSWLIEADLKKRLVEKYLDEREK